MDVICKHSLAYWTRRFLKARSEGWSVKSIAREYGWSEANVRAVLAGREPNLVEYTDSEMRRVGRRFLTHPTKSLVDKVFRGDIEAYKRCVASNFGDHL